jgi:hypothetical protein
VRRQPRRDAGVDDALHARRQRREVRRALRRRVDPDLHLRRALGRERGAAGRDLPSTEMLVELLIVIARTHRRGAVGPRRCAAAPALGLTRASRAGLRYATRARVLARVRDRGGGCGFSTRAPRDPPPARPAKDDGAQRDRT